MTTQAVAPSGERGGVSITVEGLRHVYRGRTVALDGVDLEIGTGLFGLLGPNGAGKSTLMRIVCTLLVPTAGRVRVGGHDVVADVVAVRRMLGYLPQEFSAWRIQRVREVLDLLGALSGMTDKAARQRRIDEVLDQVGLAEVADRKVKALSGGMRRRLGIAQALLHDPPVLVVDEPTVGLDPEERIRFRRLMTELGRDRVIVLSTHIVADLGPACRDVALLDAGKILFRGDPSALVEGARGRVVTIDRPLRDASPLPEGVEEVSRTTGKDFVRIRAVCAGPIPEAATPVDQPSLEEGYLAFMADRGRAAAARQEEEPS